MLYTTGLDTNLDFFKLIKQLLSSPQPSANEGDDVNEFRSSSVQPSLVEADCSQNTMIRLYIASRIVVAMQASSQLSLEQILELIQDRKVLPEHALNPFLALVSVEQNNSLSFLIEQNITADGVDMIDSFCN
jgi:hypothetical protein